METSPKVSVIVPVHNAGEHLYKCLDTLINQTLKDIEIILVLDCPTDGSDRICEDYAKNDSRIVIVKNKINLHIGLCRNEGLKLARGEYIGFSDHDDYRELDMYESLYEEAQQINADIVYSALGYLRKDGFELLLYPINEQRSLNILPVLIGNDNEIPDWNPFIRNGGIWNKIYKRSLIDDYDIRFKDNRLMTFEDLLFQIECFTFAKEIALVNRVLYFHVEDIDNTASGYSYYSYPLIVSYLKVLYQFLEDQKLFDKYSKRFYDTVVYFLITSILNELIKKSIFKINYLSLFRIKTKNKSLVNNAFQNIKFSETVFSLNKSFKVIVYKFIYLVFSV